MSTSDTAGKFRFHPSPKSEETDRQTERENIPSVESETTHPPGRRNHVKEGKDFHCGGDRAGEERRKKTQVPSRGP